MKLKVLGSNSSGNCYILETEKEALIIEAGIRFLNVKEALNFNLRKVVGCLISHQHNDHAKYAKSMVDIGIYTLALPEVFKAKNITGKKAKEISLGKGYKFGNFKVVPFPACHDVPCVGFQIEHPESGRIMFLTDSCMCEYLFPGLNHVLIECNYHDRKLIENIQRGITKSFQRERLLTTHMELESCKDFLISNDLSQVNNIVLLHLSNENSDEPFFVSEIQKQTGKVVYAAKPGLTIDISLV
jgi:phosphoribosyl 1,2-cyclic phosphodiesterase